MLWQWRLSVLVDPTQITHAPEGFIGKAVKGAAVVNLLQVFDNAANGCLRERPEGEIFSAFANTLKFLFKYLKLLYFTNCNEKIS